MAAVSLDLAGRITALIIAVLFVGRYGAGLYAWTTENRLEGPAYDVIKRLPGGVELRRYDEYNVAEVVIGKPGLREASAQGFRLCARYLFGSNRPRKGFMGSSPQGSGPEKMEMTAPVRLVGDARKTRVSFVMSRNRKISSLPVPLDSKVQLRRVAPHYAAFVRFNGSPPSDDKVAKKKEAVLSALKRYGEGAHAVKDSPALVYGYHDPFLVPSVLRRNEVGVYIDGVRS